MKDSTTIAGGQGQSPSENSANRPCVSLIWAMARNRVIGRQNTLPWRLPADLAHFKSLTSGHVVIMGRRTYESLGRPLPNRINIVVSRDTSFQCPGCLVARNLSDALHLAASHNPQPGFEVFVIGGENLYRQTLPLADRLYVTMIEAEVDGDAWFPEFDMNDWTETARNYQAADERNDHACTFLSFRRKNARSESPAGR